MPRTVFDESQNKIEVPDEAEIQALQEKAKQADELAAKLKEQEDLFKDPETVNWRAARQKIKAAEKVIKEAKESMDPAKPAIEQTTVVTPPAPAPDVNEVVTKRLAEERITDELSKYSEKERDVVKSYFDRLCPPNSPGRLDKEAVKKALADAESLALPQRRGPSAHSITSGAGMHGAPPPSVSEDSTEEQINRGKEIATAIGYNFKSPRFNKK